MSYLNSVSPTELKDLEVTFKLFDVDKDGSISKEEFKQVLKKLNLPNSDQEVQEMINSMDKNKSGLIEYHEFIKAMSKRTFGKTATAEYTSAFKQLDKNNSGYVDSFELHKMVSKIRPSMSKSEIDGLIAKCDKDKNGNLKLAEFIRLFAK